MTCLTDRASYPERIDWTLRKRAMLRVYRERGYGIAKCGKRLGVSNRAVEAQLRRMGLPTRVEGENRGARARRESTFGHAAEALSP